MAKPTKRSALEALTKRRLSALTHHFDLGVAASKPKADHLDALAGSRTATFAAILAELKRAELKDICRAHELDDSGKEKALIAARILGDEPAPAATEEAETAKKPTTKKRAAKKTKPAKATAAATDKKPAKRAAAKKKKNKSPSLASEPEQMQLPTDDAATPPKPAGGKLTLPELERHLWGAADILREHRAV